MLGQGSLQSSLPFGRERAGKVNRTGDQGSGIRRRGRGSPTIPGAPSIALFAMGGKARTQTSLSPHSHRGSGISGQGSVAVGVYRSRVGRPRSQTLPVRLPCRVPPLGNRETRPRLAHNSGCPIHRALRDGWESTNPNQPLSSQRSEIRDQWRVGRPRSRTPPLRLPCRAPPLRNRETRPRLAHNSGCPIHRALRDGWESTNPNKPLSSRQSAATRDPHLPFGTSGLATTVGQGVLGTTFAGALSWTKCGRVQLLPSFSYPVD